MKSRNKELILDGRKKTLSINRNSLNHSTSKQLNTFSKAQRFIQTRQSPHFSQRHYSEPQNLIHIIKFPTIPKAQRKFYFQAQRQLCLNPSPQTYDVRGNDQMSKVKHIGNTLGVKLSKSNKMNTPGPYFYQKETPFERKSFNKTFTFQRSTRNLNEIMNTTGRDSPGPMYNIRTTLKTERKQIITIKSKQKKQHKVKTNINLIGQKLKQMPMKKLQLQNSLIKAKQLQKFKTKCQSKKIRFKLRTRSLPSAQRIQLFSVKQTNPGPGQYEFFSQFSGVL